MCVWVHSGVFAGNFIADVGAIWVIAVQTQIDRLREYSAYKLPGAPATAAYGYSTFSEENSNHKMCLQYPYPEISHISHKRQLNKLLIL